MAVGIGDTAMLVVIGKVDGQDHLHTLHFRSAAVQDVSTLPTAWSGAASASYRGCFRVDDSPVQIVRAVHVCGSIPLNNSADLIPVAGDQVGIKPTPTPRSPSFLAALTAVKGVSSGRQNQGRFFLGGLSEGDVQGNALEPAYVTLVQAYCTALTTAFVSATTPAWRLVVHSKTRATPGTPCTSSSTLVQALLPRLGVTTMRSRKVGHGA